MTHDLYVLQDLLLELPVALDLVTGIISARLSVQRQKVSEVELGRLEELDLADVDLRSR